MVGNGSIGSPPFHIRSFQLSRRSLSACWIVTSPLARISTDWAARMLAIARALPSSFARALRSPPDCGVGWYFGAIRNPGAKGSDRRSGAGYGVSNAGQHPSSSCLPVRCWQVLSSSRCATSFQIALPPYNRTASAVWISIVRAAAAGDAQYVTLNFRKTSLPHQGPGRAGGTLSTDSQYSAGRGASGVAAEGPGLRAAASFSICFGVGMRQLAGQSVIPN
jgi:hypothetical protein